MRESPKSAKNNTMSKETLALQVVVMPEDLNGHSTLFGGKMLAWIDQAGAVIAAGHIGQRIMSVAVDDVHFKAPSFAGDLLKFTGFVKKVGRTSITVRLTVHRQRLVQPQAEEVCTGTMVYVAVDENRKPTPISIEK